jgi:hypothetical protein
MDTGPAATVPVPPDTRRHKRGLLIYRWPNLIDRRRRARRATFGEIMDRPPIADFSACQAPPCVPGSDQVKTA